MTLPEKFSQFIKAENLFQQKDRLLLAVSGGVDSVVLCDLCKKAGYDFVIAHCNFQLRSAESDADELFVKELAAKYSVDFYTRKFDTEKYAAEYKLSIQVAARNLRYEWFSQLMAENTNKPINYLLTAHHANDNIETVLMNFFKGTGIAGLQGIQPKSGEGNQLIRPLLFAKKEELLQYAAENDLSFREDSSNSSDKYTRNYFRNKLIPSLQEVYPKVEDNILGNIGRFREFNSLYQLSVNNLQKKLLVTKGNEIHIPVLKLQQTPAMHTIVYEIINKYGFTAAQVDDVIKLLKSESGKYVISQTHRILHNRNWLIISKLNDNNASNVIIEEEDTSVAFADQKLIIEYTGLPHKLDTGNSVALLDAGEISFPLLLRKWKKGDYFYPLGMQKKKKLSNFLIDNKISLAQKENTWVIEMDKKIIWVVGQRIDDRFKITGNTVKVLKLTVSSA
jgi:tRNA(Ile)-lysidine synthase